MAMIMGSVPPGRQRICVVAVTGSSVDETICTGSESEGLKIGAFYAKDQSKQRLCSRNLDSGYCSRLPSKERTSTTEKDGDFAYISNVAVRESFRRKGIAKRLTWKAEALAKNWGSRAIGLHCDLNNLRATKLYKEQGYRCIRIPEGANWPQPKTSPDTRFTS